MFTTAEKTARHAATVQQKAAGGKFFRKAGEETFFGQPESSSFFSHRIQPKLTVSSPDDPQEKEADAVAEKVMRMAEPVVPTPEKKEEKLQRSEEASGEAMEVSAEGRLQRKEETPQPVAKEDEKKLHAKQSDAAAAITVKDEKKEEKLQRKCSTILHRFSDNNHDSRIESADDSSSDQHLQRKSFSFSHTDIVQRSGRGPPATTLTFEQSLAGSKGSGSALPNDTRQFMESRFGADFSGVRIHTGSAAGQLSRDIGAQAFTHGNDIYFNSGKFSPQTADGGTLLAHELTHTIQQGASPGISSPASGNTTTAAPKAVAKKELPARKSSQHEKTVTERPKTLQELRRDAFHVDRQEERHLPEPFAPATDQQPQSQNEHSQWQVSANGKLHTGEAPSPPGFHLPIQPKEEPRKEKEEEKKVAIPHNVLQKKSTGAWHADSVVHKRAVETVEARQPASNKTGVGDHLLNRTPNMAVAPSAEAMDRGPPVAIAVAQRTGVVQRSWLSNAWNAVSNFAGEAAQFIAQGLDAAKQWILRRIRTFVQNIPGYRMFSLILRHDPITGEGVERNGRNLLLAGLDLLPLGNLFGQVLERIGAIDEAAAWIEGRIADLSSMIAGIGSRFTAFMARLSLDDIGHPEQVLDNVADLFRGIYDDVMGFLRRAAVEFLQMIKRIMLRLIVDFVRERVPRLYPLLRVALGHDPVTGETVAQNGTNILYAALDATDAGREQRRQMQETGTFQRIAAWIDRGIAVFATAYQQLRAAFTNLWASVTIENLFSPVETFTRIYNDFAAPIALVGNFLRDLAVEIVRAIKDALLRRLRDFARGIRGYSLITVIIGRDPFTGEQVPRTIPNIIRGFMSLMDGGEEQYRQMEESGAIARTTQRITAAVARLNMTPAYVIQLFTAIWNSFGLNDLTSPVAAFQRVMARFGEPIGRLIDFVIEIVRIVVEVILQVMNFPTDLIANIITRAMQAFDLIKQDPVGFLKNLLRAVKQGFIQFFGNILTHLLNGLRTWFLNEVRAAGIPIPTDFSVMGIIRWLLAVLDITMEKIWKKLEERIGREKVARIRSLIERAERVAAVAGEAYEFYQDVQRRGFMAVMIDKMKEKLSNVWELVLESVKNFIMTQVISRVTARLLSMLDPTGIMAVINSAIALYRAIQSFIRYLRQILEIVNSFVEGVVEIASGAIQKAANFVEGSLGRGIPVVIGFLANQIGLNLSERLRDALQFVREKVDAGLTWVIDRLVTIVERLVAMGRAAVASLVQWWKAKKEFTANDNKKHKVYLEGNAENPVLTIQSDPMPYTNFLNSYETSLGASANDEVTVGTAKKTKAAVIAEARGVAAKIETEKRKAINTYPGADDKAKEEQKKLAVDALLLELATISVPLFGTEKPKDSEIVLPPGVNNHQFATVAEAVNIYKTPKVTSNGSAPTAANHNIYKIIDNRQKGNASYYIRGHLINDNLGGPGMWSNMTALSRTGNHKHEELVESKVKAAFDAGAVIRYKVQTSGSLSTTEPTAASKNQFSKVADFDANFELLKNIINAEKNVITTLQCEAYTRKKEGSNWVDDKEIVKTPVTNEVELGYGTYELGDNIPSPIVNLTAGENLDKLPQMLHDFTGNKIALASNVIRFVHDKITKTGVTFGTYDGLASYKMVITPEPLTTAEFSAAEKSYIKTNLKNNNNVKLS